MKTERYQQFQEEEQVEQDEIPEGGSQKSMIRGPIEQEYSPSPKDDELGRSGQYKSPMQEPQLNLDMQRSNRIENSQLWRTTQEQQKEIITQRQSIRTASLLYVLILVIVVGVITKYITYHEGNNLIHSGTDISLKVKNCKINFFDVDSYSDVLGKAIPELDSVEQDQFIIYYKYLKDDSVFKFFGDDSLEINHNDQIFEMNLENTFKYQNCEIALFIYAQITINQLAIECIGECYIAAMAKNATINSFSIKGDYVESNIAYLSVHNMSYYADNGRFQATYLDFSGIVNINLPQGDIIVQSDKEFMINWSHSFPHYCLTAPKFVNLVVEGCEQPSNEEVDSYINGVGKPKKEKTNQETEQSEELSLLSFNSHKPGYEDVMKQSEDSSEEDNYKNNLKKTAVKVNAVLKQHKQSQLLKPSCFGKALLCKTEVCSEMPSNLKSQHYESQHRLFNVTAKFGNIYANLISNAFNVTNQADIIIQGDSYKNEFVNISAPGIQQLQHYLKLGQDPHHFDPIFILKFGSKITRSDNYQQWQITYNPAYSYIKPWWIGTFSLTIMTTATYSIPLTLSPGFCPYSPTLNLNEVYQTKYLIDQQFKSAQHSIQTLAWQINTPLPEVNSSNQSNGFRKYSKSFNEPELWLQFQKQNETTFIITPIDYSANTMALSSLIVSLVIAFIVALLEINGLLYIIIKQYHILLNSSKRRNKYIALKYKKESVNSDDMINHNYQDNEDEESQRLNNRDQDIDDIEDDVYFSIWTWEMIKQLISQIPPLTATIDFLISFVFFRRSNNMYQFYALIFERQLTTNDVNPATVEIEMERSLDPTFNNEQQNENVDYSNATPFAQLKQLYEQYCYLNYQVEQQLDDTTSLALIETYGHQIILMPQEFYTRVQFVGSLKHLAEIPNDPNSLELYIDNCFTITGYEKDQFELRQFEANYQQFCIMNHLVQQTIDEDCIKQCKIGKITNQIQYMAQIPGQTQYTINTNNLKNMCLILEGQKISHLSEQDLCYAYTSLIQPVGLEFLKDFFSAIYPICFLINIIVYIMIGLSIQTILYAPFSLIQDEYLIFQFTDQLLLQKLYSSDLGVQIIFWYMIIISFGYIFEVLMFYWSKDFEKQICYKKIVVVKLVGWRRVHQIILWCSFLLFIYFICVYITLVAVWLMLSAIVNPTAFLPYATSAVTFITVVINTSVQFRLLRESGYAAVLKQIEKITGNKLGNILKKLDFQQSADSILSNPMVNQMTLQAAQLGLIQQDSANNLQAVINDYAANPTKLIEESANEFQAFIKNPSDYIQNTMQNIEKATINSVKVFLEKQIPIYGADIADIAISAIKQDSILFRAHLVSLIEKFKLQEGQEGGFIQVLPLVLQLINKAIVQDNSQQSYNIINDTSSQQLAIVGSIIEVVVNSYSIQFPLSELQKAELYQILKLVLSLEFGMRTHDKIVILKTKDEFLKHNDLLHQNSIFKVMSEYNVFYDEAVTLVGGSRSHPIKIINAILNQYPQLNDVKGIISLIENAQTDKMESFKYKLIMQQIQSIIRILNKDNSLLTNQLVSIICINYQFIQSNIWQCNSKVASDLLLYSLSKDTTNINQQFCINALTLDYKSDILLNYLVFINHLTQSTKQLPKIAETADRYNIDLKKAEELQTFILKNIESDSNNRIIDLIGKMLRLEYKVTIGLLYFFSKQWDKVELMQVQILIANVNQLPLRTITLFFEVLQVSLESGNIFTIQEYDSDNCANRQKSVIGLSAMPLDNRQIYQYLRNTYQLNLNQLEKQLLDKFISVRKVFIEHNSQGLTRNQIYGLQSLAQILNIQPSILQNYYELITSVTSRQFQVLLNSLFRDQYIQQGDQFKYEKFINEIYDALNNSQQAQKLFKNTISIIFRSDNLAYFCDILNADQSQLYENLELGLCYLNPEIPPEYENEVRYYLSRNFNKQLDIEGPKEIPVDLFAIFNQAPMSELQKAQLTHDLLEIVQADPFYIKYLKLYSWLAQAPKTKSHSNQINNSQLEQIATILPMNVNELILLNSIMQKSDTSSEVQKSSISLEVQLNMPANSASYLTVSTGFIESLQNLAEGKQPPVEKLMEHFNINDSLISFAGYLAYITRQITQFKQCTNQVAKVNGVLNTLAIQDSELQALLKLIYFQYGKTSISEILQALTLWDKFDYKSLSSIFRLNQTLDVAESDQNITSQLNQQLNTNDILISDSAQLPMNHNQYLPINLIKFTKILTQGAVSLIPNQLDNQICYGYPKNSNSELYIQVVQSLIGCISSPQLEEWIDTKLFRESLRNYAIPNEFKQNGLLYNTVKLSNLLNIPPIISMIAFKIEVGWQLICKQVDILSLSMLFIVVQQTPTLIKELLVEYYWLKNQMKLPDSKIDSQLIKQEALMTLKQQIVDSLHPHIHQIESQIIEMGLECIFEVQTDNAWQLSLTSQICLKLEELMTSKKLEQKYFNYAGYIIKNIRGLPLITWQKITQLLSELSNDTMGSLEQFQQILKDLIITLQWDLFEQVIIKMVQLFDPQCKYSTEQTFHQFLFMCNLSSVRNHSSLQIKWESALNTQNLTSKLDFALTYLERCYYEKDFMNYFSKTRLMQLLGIASGHLINSDMIIRANTLKPIFNYQLCYQLTQMNPIQQQTHKKQLMSEYVNNRCQKYTNMDQRIFKAYDIVTILSDQSTSKFNVCELYPENYYLNSIQRQIGLQQTGTSKVTSYTQLTSAHYSKQIIWEDYFIDIQFVSQLCEFVGCIQYKSINKFNNQPFSDQNRLLIINDYCQSIKIQNTIDIKTDQSWQDIINQQQEWTQYMVNQGQNWQTLINIFKSNYQQLDQSIFPGETEQINIQLSLLGLQGAANKTKKKYAKYTIDQLATYVSQCCFYGKSSKKAITQLLSIYLDCYEGLNHLCNVYQQPSPPVYQLIMLTCGLSKQINILPLTQNLISFLIYPLSNNEQLQSIIYAQHGEYCKYLAIQQNFQTEQGRKDASTEELLNRKQLSKIFDQIEQDIPVDQSQQLQQLIWNQVNQSEYKPMLDFNLKSAAVDEANAIMLSLNLLIHKSDQWTMFEYPEYLVLGLKQLKLISSVKELDELCFKLILNGKQNYQLTEHQCYRFSQLSLLLDYPIVNSDDQNVKQQVIMLTTQYVIATKQCNETFSAKFYLQFKCEDRLFYLSIYLWKNMSRIATSGLLQQTNQPYGDLFLASFIYVVVLHMETISKTKNDVNKLNVNKVKNLIDKLRQIVDLNRVHVDKLLAVVKSGQDCTTGQWQLWIQLMPTLIKIISQFYNKHQLDLLDETIFILKISTGYQSFELVKNYPFFGNLFIHSAQGEQLKNIMNIIGCFEGPLDGKGLNEYNILVKMMKFRDTHISSNNPIQSLDCFMEIFHEVIQHNVKLAPQLQKEDQDRLNQINTTILVILVFINGQDMKQTGNSQEVMQMFENLKKSILSEMRLNLNVLNNGYFSRLAVSLIQFLEMPNKSLSNPLFQNELITLLQAIAGEQTEARRPLFKVPSNLLRAIIQLLQGEISGLPILLKEMNVGDSYIQHLETAITQLNSFSKLKQQHNEFGLIQQEQKTVQVKQLIEKLDLGEATEMDIFQLIDDDGNGSISQAEYTQFARRIGMNLSEHRVIEIFAVVKQGKVSDTNEQQLNPQEFKKAMEYIRQSNADLSLEFLGISPKLLTQALFVIVFILILIFVFIFLGINSFALGGTFGAIINSLMPILAGLGVSNSKVKKIGEESKDSDEIEKSVDISQKIISSKDQ